MTPTINLIPKAIIQRFRHNRIKAAWTRIILITTAVCVMVIIYGQASIYSDKARIAAEEADASLPRTLQRDNGKLKRELLRVRNYESQQKQLRSQHSPLAVFSLLTQVKADLNGKLDVELVDYRLETDPNSKSNGSVLLSVITEGTSNSSQLLQLLRQSNRFQSVQLSGTLQKLAEDNDDLRFNIQCVF